MLHIFISYAHDGGAKYRDEFIARLKEAGFNDDDYWYDQRDIDAGDEWRESIDKALNESFIVIIILTRNALKSHFVTYEWARAIGDGIKVIPLLFESLPSKSNHPLLERKQYSEWYRKDIPKKVIDTIKQHHELPPDTIHLNQLILQRIMPLRAFLRLTIWFYDYVCSGAVKSDVFWSLLEKSHAEAGTLFFETLPEFMVDKSYAFSSKQRRKCRELILKLKDLYWKMDGLRTDMLTVDTFFEPTANSAHQLYLLEEDRLERLEPIIQSFDETYSEYKALDQYLRGISASRISIISEMNASDLIRKISGEDYQAIWDAVQVIGKMADKQH